MWCIVDVNGNVIDMYNRKQDAEDFASCCVDEPCSIQWVEQGD